METPNNNTPPPLPPPVSPENSTELLLQQAATPNQVAMDTPPEAPQAQQLDNPFNEPTEHVTPANDEPIFKRDDEELTDTAKGPAVKEYKLTKDDARDEAELFIEFRDIIQPELFAMLASSNDPARFEYSESQKEKLIRIYTRIAQKHGNKIPDWIYIVAVELTTTGKIGLTAFKEGRTVRANERELQNNASSIAETLQQVSAKDAKTERKNFQLYNDGFYRNDRNGAYVDRRNGKKEKPDLKDLERIATTKGNSVELICKAFNMTPDKLKELTGLE